MIKSISLMFSVLIERFLNETTRAYEWNAYYVRLKIEKKIKNKKLCISTKFD